MASVYVETFDGIEYRVSGTFDLDLDEVIIVRVHRAGHHHVNGIFHKRWLASSTRELEKYGLLQLSEDRLAAQSRANIEAARDTFAEAAYEAKMERKEIGE
jgi:hypothetical protein